MWILMLLSAAGPRLPHALIAEKTYEVPDELARELIEARAAKEVPAPKAPGAPETAQAQAGETSITPAPDKKNSLMAQLTAEETKAKTDEAIAYLIQRGKTPEAAAAIVERNGPDAVLLSKNLDLDASDAGDTKDSKDSKGAKGATAKKQ